MSADPTKLELLWFGALLLAIGSIPDFPVLGDRKAEPDIQAGLRGIGLP